MVLKAFRVVQDEVNKMSQYRFWDKERERSNQASGLNDRSKTLGIRRALCPTRHETVAWTGPPHDAVQGWVCLQCNAVCCEPEVKDRGYDFATVPGEIIDEILDLDLERMASGNFTSYQPIK